MIFVVLLFFVLVVITYIALLPQLNTRIYIKHILRTPPQELRNGTFLKACTGLRRANGMS